MKWTDEADGVWKGAVRGAGPVPSAPPTPRADLPDPSVAASAAPSAWLVRRDYEPPPAYGIARVLLVAVVVWLMVLVTMVVIAVLW